MTPILSPSVTMGLSVRNEVPTYMEAAAAIVLKASFL